MHAPTPFTPQQDFDVGSLYSGTYVKADDLAGKTYTARIVAVERVEIAEQDGSVRPKAAVALQGWPAKLLLNKTNFEAIATAYGRQSAGWIGKLLEVYPDTTSFGGRSVPCVRVRVPRPAVPATAVPGVIPVAPAALAVAVPEALSAAAPQVPSASIAAASVQATPQLPPLLTAGDFKDDIPY